jgi:enterochelin esterase-like enzyme
MKRLAFGIGLACLAAILIGCNQKSRKTAPISPQVNPAGTVTLRFQSTGASVVMASGDIGSWTLTKGANGVWSATTGQLKPAIYTYFFSVDGVKMSDPLNPDRKGTTESLVTIPGNPPMPWERRDVPHGSVTQVLYQSKVLNAKRRYFVYTPPGYSKTTRKLPVLYLLHGWSDDDSTWTAVGKANLIADNLLADHEISPLIIVMPYGQLNPSVSTDEAITSFSKKYEQELLTEIIPAVDKAYRTVPAAKGRAIAGNSMGGMQAALVGMNHPEIFSTVGMWSPAIFTDPSMLFAGLTAASNRLKHSFSYVEVRVGEQDSFYGRSVAIDQYLTAQKIAHVFAPTPGEHSWVTWRPYLVAFLKKFSPPHNAANK